jgi:ribosomal protein S18 acetylase RimI-like enzyme
MDVLYTEGNGKLLDQVGPLWEMLNVQHTRQCEPFRVWFSKRTFEDRRADLLEKLGEGQVHVVLARDGEHAVGYCVSTVSASGKGEIDSLFLLPHYRGQGIGDELMLRSLNWLKMKQAKRISVLIAAGNVDVLSFYARYGFAHRAVIMEIPEEGV